MPRPREFELFDVLDRATRLFWQRGYGGTSLNDLEQAMGIGRTSIYAAFGGKESLFLQVIDHYDANYNAKLRVALRSGASARASIERYFAEVLKAFSDPEMPPGCLLTNVAVEGDRGATRLGRKIAQSVSRTEDAFYEVLRDGQAKGEVDRDVDVRGLSRYFVAVTHGLSTLAKSHPSASALKDVVDAAMADLDGLLNPDAGRARKAADAAIIRAAAGARIPVTRQSARPARFTLAHFWSLLPETRS
jgi:TetR/AcrR family transcriptional repressor of nem operon